MTAAAVRPTVPPLRLVGNRAAISRRERMLAEGRRAEAFTHRCEACKEARRQWLGAVNAWQHLPIVQRRITRQPTFTPPHANIQASNGHWCCLLTTAPAQERRRIAEQIQERALPDADHVCPRCGHGSAELATRVQIVGASRCYSCRLDLIAAKAAKLQAQGIYLGWSATPREQQSRFLSGVDIQSMSTVRRR